MTQKEIDKKSFSAYYLEHSMKEICDAYEISRYTAYKIAKKLGLSKKKGNKGIKLV